MNALGHWLRNQLGGGEAPKVTQRAPGLTLYQFPACPFCRRVQKQVNRLGLELDQRNIQRDPKARRELVAGGGRQTVPCLRIETEAGTRWMYESGDIIRYLQARFHREA